MKTAVPRPPSRAFSLFPSATAALVAALGIGCGASGLPPASSPVAAASKLPARQQLAINSRRCGVCHELADPPDTEGLIQPELDRFSLRSFLATALPERPAPAQRGSWR